LRALRRDLDRGFAALFAGETETWVARDNEIRYPNDNWGGVGDIMPSERSMAISFDELLLASEQVRHELLQYMAEYGWHGESVLDPELGPARVELLGNGPQYEGRCYGRAAIVLWPRANRDKIQAMTPAGKAAQARAAWRAARNDPGAPPQVVAQLHAIAIQATKKCTDLRANPGEGLLGLWARDGGFLHSPHHYESLRYPLTARTRELIKTSSKALLNKLNKLHREHERDLERERKYERKRDLERERERERAPGPELEDSGAAAASARCARPGCTTNASSECGACKSVSYCSVACQKSHWGAHKAACSGKSK
jgi:hypothetical protein